MALFARTTVETVDFVSAMDPDYVVEQVPLDPANPALGTVEQVTIRGGASHFKLRPLDVFLMGHIYDNATSMVGTQGSVEVGIKTKMNMTNIDTVRFGLCALPENFQDRQGNVVKFAVRKESINGREYTVVTDEVMTTLGLQLIQEMAGKIKELSEVTADNGKNSAEV